MGMSYELNVRILMGFGKRLRFVFFCWKKLIMMDFGDLLIR